MKSKFTTVTVLILSSAICWAGLFDKLNNVANSINPANTTVKTDTPSQETATNPPEQNSQVPTTNTVETQQPSAASTASQANGVQSQSGQIANTSPQIAKAYKTLNFGDNSDMVDNKLVEILGDTYGIYTGDHTIALEETFWKSLFDTDADYEPYKFDGTLISQSDKLTSLMHYFGSLAVVVHSSRNSATSVECYQLHDSGHGSLAVVKVSYITFDVDKLVEGFMQNYPNAQKETKPFKIENVIYPGITLEYERLFFSDINQDRRAMLSVPSKNITFVFTEPSKLSQDQLAVWNSGMTMAGKTDINEFFESVKASLLQLVKNIDSDDETRKRLVQNLDPMAADGWKDYSHKIYDAPYAVFASKQILDPLMNNYRQSIETADQEQKAKLKKESDSSSGF